LETTFRSSSLRQKRFGKRIPKFKTKDKNENTEKKKSRRKKSHGGWKEKILFVGAFAN
jgi:hypothetical protein